MRPNTREAHYVLENVLAASGVRLVDTASVSASSYRSVAEVDDEKLQARWWE